VELCQTAEVLYFLHGILQESDRVQVWKNTRNSLVLNFILVVPCIVNLFYESNKRDAVLGSLFIVLQNHSTRLGCPLRPSSGVHRTVVTTTGTSHVYRWHRSKIR